MNKIVISGERDSVRNPLKSPNSHTVVTKRLVPTSVQDGSRLKTPNSHIVAPRLASNSFQNIDHLKTPNSHVVVTSHLAPNILKDGASPQSIIGALADEIKKEDKFATESADQIFASVDESMGPRLKQSRIHPEAEDTDTKTTQPKQP